MKQCKSIKFVENKRKRNVSKNEITVRYITLLEFTVLCDTLGAVSLIGMLSFSDQDRKELQVTGRTSCRQ